MAVLRHPASGRGLPLILGPPPAGRESPTVDRGSSGWWSVTAAGDLVDRRPDARGARQRSRGGRHRTEPPVATRAAWRTPTVTDFYAVRDALVNLGDAVHGNLLASVSPQSPSRARGGEKSVTKN